MFSVSIFMVLLVISVSKGQNTTIVPASFTTNVKTNSAPATPSTNFVEPTTATKVPTTPSPMAQGQNSTAVSPSATFSYVVSQSSITTTPNGPPTTEPTTGTSEKPTTSSEKIYTCTKLRVTIDSLWEEDYGNKSSKLYRSASKVFSSTLEKLYDTTHNDVKVSDVTFKNKTGKLFAEAKLCLVFKKGEDSIKDVFFDKVKTGKLPEGLPVVNDSAEFEASKVEYKNYKAKEGECDKCDGAGGPFDIEGECVPDSKEFSCNGLEEKKTKETKECTTYCPSTALTATVSSLILAIGILLSSSFQ